MRIRVLALLILAAPDPARGNDGVAARYEPVERPVGYFHAHEIVLEVSGSERLRRARDRAEDGDRLDETQKDPLSKEELAKELPRALDDVLGYDERALRLRVDVLEASIREDPPRTSVRLAVHAYDAKGRELSVTQRRSTLVGHLGGMARRPADHLLAALVDGFERAVLDDDFIDATNAGLASPMRRTPRVVPPRTQASMIEPHDESGGVHVLGAALDIGKSVSVGPRYLHDHVHTQSGMLWGGYGADARVVTIDGERIDAAVGLAVLRGGMWVEQGVGLEIGLGAGGGDEITAVGLVGLFFTAYYVDLGFTYQMPFGAERPDWMAGPNFGLRINVPIAVHGRRLSCRSPEPCEYRSVVLQR